MARQFAIALLLAASTVAVYHPVTEFPFVSIDDSLYVTANAEVQKGLSWDGVRWAMTNASDGNWLPVTWLSHMADVSMFGMDAGAHHGTNLLLHVLSTLLLFFAFSAMTGRDAESAVVAGLFALHPTHVESVAWVAERKDVLSGFFGLAALALYVGWAQRGGWFRYSALLAVFGLGLMSKSMLVTLPFVMLLLDLWPLGRLRAGAAGFEGWLATKSRSLRAGRYREASLRSLVVEKLPLFAGVLAVAALTFAAQKGRGAMIVASSVDWPERLANAVVSWERYALNTFWPVGLAVQVPHPYLPSEGGTGLSILQLGLAAAFLVASSLFAIRRGGPIGVGWLWFVGMLVPVIGIVQVGPQGLADRYTYLPAIGLYVAIVFGGSEWVSRRARLRRLGSAALVVALVGCVLASAVQLQSWRDSRSLYRRSLQVDAGNLAAHYSLASEYRATGEEALAKAHYRAILERQPRAARAHNGLGLLLRKEGRLREAVVHLERALASQPDLFLALNNLGNVQRDLGHFETAELHYRAALRVAPGATNAQLNLANLLRDQARREEALEMYREAVSGRPSSLKARNSLAELLVEMGRSADAQAQYRAILDLAPDDVEARGRLEDLRRAEAPGPVRR